MNLLERISGLLRPAEPHTIADKVPGLRAYIESIRRAKLAEDYPHALTSLERALELVQKAEDHAGAVVLLLQKADILIRQQAYELARAVLDEAEQKAGDQKVQVAYVLTARGALAAAQSDEDAAHSHYDRALALAREAGSPGAEGRAQGLRAVLFLRDGNASYAAHLLKDALPKLNAAADIELSPFFLGLYGEASLQNGQTAEGVHLLERALELAHQMADRMNERRWALALGERAMLEGRFTEARTYYKRAVRLFGEQVNREHVLALCQLSRVQGNLNTLEDALLTAQSALTMSSALDAEAQRSAHSAAGIAMRAAGRHADAIPHLRQATEAENTVPSIEMLRALSLSLSETGDNEDALRVTERALEQAEREGDVLNSAHVRRNLGLLYFRDGRTQDAVTQWAQALTGFEEKHAYAQIARLLCDLGYARKLLGMQQRAIRDYELALTMLNSVPSEDLQTRGVVLSNAANAYAEQGDADSADAFFNEAIALSEKTGDSIAESTRRNNYGYFLVQIGRPRRAIAVLEQALRISQQQGLALATAIQKDNLGLAYASAGDYPIALDHHRQALAAVLPLEQAFWRASIQINLAHTLLLHGDTTEAAPLAADALAYARTDSQTDLLARVLLIQALLALKAQNTASAQPLIEEALTLAKRADNRRWIAEAYSTRSELRAQQGDETGAQADWSEAARYYNMLRMPQGKRTPAWLAPTQKA
jgi:tetratricopeptide (TPR) repeat protein